MCEDLGDALASGFVVLPFVGYRGRVCGGRFVSGVGVRGGEWLWGGGLRGSV